MQHEHFILIDSRLRDTSKYITPAQYVFELSSPLHNVKSIQLVHAIYGKNDSNLEKYAYLCVKELPTKQFISLSRSPFDDNIFTYLPFHKQGNDTTEYEFTPQTLKVVCTFEQPLPELATLSIALFDKDGRLFPIQEHIMCFMVTTIEDAVATVDLLGSKPVYKTPYEMFGLVQGTFSLEMLVDRFKQQANMLRSSGSYSPREYDELKQAFKRLASTLKKDAI